MAGSGRDTLPSTGPGPADRPRLFTAGGMAVLAFAAIVVAATSVERYRDPVGEKYIPVMAPGAADFRVTFTGTRALLRGMNPYEHTLPGRRDPWGRDYRVPYPPSHFLFYVPLAAFEDDPRQAGRVLFWLNLVLLMLLAFLTRRMLVDATDPPAVERRYSWLLVPLLYFVLTANVGTCLGLERGQSDILNATLCWGAVVLFLNGRRALPAFLITSAILLKGYALLLGIGLVLLGLPRRGWRPLLLGTAAAGGLLLLPVLPYVPSGLEAARWRAQDNIAWDWFNHGFLNLCENLWPAAAQPGRLALTALAGLVSVACWLLARKALGEGDRSSAGFWVPVFAATALATPIGYGSASFVYNQILLLPGALVLLLLGGGTRPAASALAVFLLFTYRFRSDTFPVASLGLLLLLLIAGECALSRLARQSVESRP